MTPDQALSRLGELGNNEDLDHVAALPSFAYDEVAALIAIHEGASTTVAELSAALDRLAQPIPHAQGQDLFLEVARVNHELFSVHGFTGDTDTYDDPKNSLLDVVLDRRRGLPILLSLVVMEVARRTSLHLAGVGFPGHFLVTPISATEPFFLDPFHGGQALSPDQLRARFKAQHPEVQITAERWAAWTKVVTPRELFVRINHNLRASWLRRGDLAGTRRAVQRLRQLVPHDPRYAEEQAMIERELRRQSSP